MKYEERYTSKQLANHKIWLAQLRDKSALKTHGKLEDANTPNSRCCLGHACHALGYKRKVFECDLGGPDVFYDDQVASLSIEVQNDLGIDSVGTFRKRIRLDESRIKYSHLKPVFQNLSDINDRTNLTLGEIADLIEAQLKTDNFVEPYD